MTGARQGRGSAAQLWHCIDSAQPSESPDLAPFLSRFTTDFHEPYYKGYLRDPLEDAMAEVGFETPVVERNFVSKIVVARKPA